MLTKRVLHRLIIPCLLLTGFALTAFIVLKSKPVRIFDGKTFKGWEGDTVKTWRIENGALVGGSLTEKVPNNNFLVTTKTYSNFILKTKFKLLGTEGFINTGVQFHSQRLTNPSYEMTGYQADLGNGYWASLYDESRRNKTLISPDSSLIKKILKPGTWNDYEVISESGRIRIKLNGVQTIDYVEPDKSIPQSGYIGLQIHGGGKAEVHFKDMWIQEL
jgi:hypothetical protein